MTAPAKQWREEAPTRCERLRAILSGGSGWIPHRTMMAAGGSRFGARLETIRNGWDGGTPWLVEVRGLGTTSPEYRYVGVNPLPRAKPSKRSACPDCHPDSDPAHVEVRAAFIRAALDLAKHTDAFGHVALNAADGALKAFHAAAAEYRKAVGS